jgi:peptidoglycan biosynthesis protein MviN/MurJ (putative lipid II flippase)
MAPEIHIKTHHLRITQLSALRERWKATHSITTGFVSVASFLLIAKAIAAGKEVVVAQVFGTSATLEGYLFVFTLYAIPASIGYSVMFAILVPLLAVDGNSLRGSRLFRSETLGLLLIVGLLLGVAFAIGMHAWLTHGDTGLSPECTAAAIGAVWPLSVTVVLALLAGLMSTWIMSTGGHTNTLFEAGPAVGIAVAVIFWPDATLASLVWGTIAGYCLQILGLALLLKKCDYLSKPALGFKSTLWNKLQVTFTLVIFTYIITAIGGALDLYLAAKLEQGSIATMGYANRVMALFLGLLATAVGRSALPSLSATYSTDPVTTTRVAIRYSWILWLVGTAGFGLVVLGAHQLVALIFERGAFTSTDTDRVSSVLTASSLQLPFYSAALIVLSLLTSSKRYGVILVIAASGLVAKVISAFVLTQQFGLNGLMISNSIMHCTTLICGLLAIAGNRHALTTKSQ